MQIDLNDPGALTLASVKALIASGDDSTHSQIRVTNGGIVFVSKVVGNKDLDDLSFRLETCTAGAGYIGPEAAKDEGWVQRVYEVIMTNWPNPKDTYIDYF